MGRTLLAGCVGTALCALVCCEDASPEPDSDSVNVVCKGDYSDLPTAAVSLEHDLMPIFRESCTFSSCHDTSAKKAGLVLGDPNADLGDPNLLKDVRESLLAPSTTVKSPAVPRVTPGDPTKSFLLDKVTGTQNGRGYACENQAPVGSPRDACGDAMPLGDATFCATQPGKIIAIARWIRDGALQD